MWSHTDTVLYVFSTVVYPWYMTLLFVIAGISCKYALQKRTDRQFIVERTKKLLIPFVFGVLVLATVMTYIAEVFFNGYTDSYWKQYILFFTKETDLTGYHGGFTPAHFWFLLYLFIISLAALLVIRLQEKYLPKFQIGGIPYVFILLLFIPEWLCQYVLNIGGKSLGQFMALFLFGYYIFSEEDIQQKLKRYWFVSLAFCILSGSLYTYLYCFADCRSAWITGLFIFYGWMGIITLLGMGQSVFNFHNRFSDYLTQESFSIYMLHMPVLAVIGFEVLKVPIGAAGQFFLIVLISVIVTFGIYEIIKRVSVLRFFFGMGK